jgi:hypothetical protein
MCAIKYPETMCGDDIFQTNDEFAVSSICWPPSYQLTDEPEEVVPCLVMGSYCCGVGGMDNKQLTKLDSSTTQSSVKLVLHCTQLVT